MLKGMLKRALGVVAAAAMAVTGAVALSGTANAAEVTGDVQFTFTAGSGAQLTDRTIEVYKIGKFTSYTNNDTTYYGVESANDETTLTEAVNDAFYDSTAEPSTSMPTGEDPMTWAAAQGLFDGNSTGSPWNQSDTRDFANYLEQHKTGLTKYTVNGANPTLTAPYLNESTGLYESTLTLPAGVYLIVDTTPETDEITQAVPMIVYSGTFTPASESSPATFTNPDQPGTGSTVNFKNTKGTLPTKTMEEGKDSVSVGDTIEYTLQYTIPNPAPETFQFNDRPSRGLTVDYNSIKVTASVSGQLHEGTANPVTNDYHVVKNLAGTGLNEGDNSAFFSIVLHNLDALAGQTVTVTYDATVNPSAATEKNPDKVWNELVSNDGTVVYSHVESKLYEFAFKKTKADGITALSGAEFTISGDSLPEDYTPMTATSDSNGIVKFDGLAAGSYTVTETKVPDDFLQNVKPSFTVTIDNNGDVTYTENTDWGLVTDNNDNTATVKNVENITQLPLTGAAGTMLFTVLGLLIAAAGVTVYMKSRSVRKAMRA